MRADKNINPPVDLAPASAFLQAIAKHESGGNLWFVNM